MVPKSYGHNINTDEVKEQTGTTNIFIANTLSKTTFILLRNLLIELKYLGKYIIIQIYKL